MRTAAYTGAVRAIILIAVLALAGCSAHTAVRLGSGSANVAPGTSVSTSSLSLRVQTSNTAGVLIALGAVAAAIHGGDREGYGLRFRANPFLAVQPEAAAPQQDAARRVHEQDCSRPIEDLTANLRCR